MPNIDSVKTFPPLTTTNFESSPIDATMTIIQASATPNVKGNWTQLLASTAKKVSGIVVAIVGGTVANILIDIGTGAAASETVLIPNIWACPNTGVGIWAKTIFFPLELASGTRIAARCQSSPASANPRIGVMLMEID